MRRLFVCSFVESLSGDLVYRSAEERIARDRVGTPAPWFADPADHAGGTFEPSRDVLTMDAARVAPPAGLPCCLVSVPGEDGVGRWGGSVPCVC